MAKRILLMTLMLVIAPMGWANSRRVAVLYWSSNIEGQVAMRSGLEAEAEKYNKKAPAKKRLCLNLLSPAMDGQESKIKLPSSHRS